VRKASLLLSALPFAWRAPLFVGKWLRILAFLGLGTLVFAVVGFTALTGEPRAWAQVLAVVLGLLFLAALVATAVIARRALRALRSLARTFREAGPERADDGFGPGAEPRRRRRVG
jgi:hypothetical protein